MTSFTITFDIPSELDARGYDTEKLKDHIQTIHKAIEKQLSYELEHHFSDIIEREAPEAYEAMEAAYIHY